MTTTGYSPATRVGPWSDPPTASVGAYNPIGLRLANPAGWALLTSRAVPPGPTRRYGHDPSTGARNLEDSSQTVSLDAEQERCRLVWRPPPLQRPALLRLLSGYRGVLPRPELQGDTAAHATLLARTAMLGIPLLSPWLPHPVAGLLAEDLAAALTSGDPAAMDDPLEREGHSIRLRRAALSGHGTAPGAIPVAGRTISVLLAASRPDQLDLAVAHVASQRHPRVELVVALHGDVFPSDVERRIRRLHPGPVQVLRRPAADSLGVLLNHATAAASGELLAKMDDDDLYGPHHLWDLELARTYSGASISGKGAEFVHLEPLNVTIRRFRSGAESWHNVVGGGTLLLAKDDLNSLGGWPEVRRRVDRELIARVERGGGNVYRTHGLEYVLRRSADPHTWRAPLGYFLRQAQDQWRGLPRAKIGLQPAPPQR